MRCLSCDYELSGLTEHRCPECGRGFDPRDVRTFRSDEWFYRRCGRCLRSARWCAYFPAVAIVALSIVIFLAALFDESSLHSRSGFRAQGVFLVGFIAIVFSVFVAFVLLVLALIRVWRGGSAMRKRALAAGFVIMCIGGMLFMAGSIIAYFLLHVFYPAGYA